MFTVQWIHGTLFCWHCSAVWRISHWNLFLWHFIDFCVRKKKKKITRISSSFWQLMRFSIFLLNFCDFSSVEFDKLFTDYNSTTTSCSTLFFLHIHINHTTWRMWNDVKFINTDKHRKYNIKIKCRICVFLLLLFDFQINCDKMK